MAKPREIDMPLVDAYLARRALDYLVGFTLSPILWRKLPGSRSAGRVQSVALRLVSDREAEIEKFKADEYWSVEAKLAQKGKSFPARLFSVDGKKTDKLDIKTGENAAELKKLIEAGQFNVSAVDKKPTKRNPYAPFTTSSLQQDASSRLGLSPSRTMQIAQRLYEDGLITYMRTDAVQMAPEGISMARSVIGKYFGPEYLPEKPRIYQTKAKNAQEAHEAIRPTDMFKPTRAAQPRCRPVQALWPDLAPHARLADEIGRDRSHHGGYRRQRARPRCRAACRGFGRYLPRLPQALWRRGQVGTRKRKTRIAVNCRRWPLATSRTCRPSRSSSISPSRHRAIPRRA